MRAFPDLTDLDTFPYPESSWLEFKETVEAAKNKLIPTVCAFLNTEGGYLVVGVVDISLDLKGIRKTKEYDGLVLLVDNIYHTKNIISEDGNSVPIGHVSIKLIETATKAKLAVVTVLPGNGVKYKCLMPGRTSLYTSYYRLNASNYNILNHIENKIYTQEDLNAALQVVRDKYQDKVYSEKEFRQTLWAKTNKLQEKINKQAEQFQEVLGASKEIERKLEDILEERRKQDKLLMAMILEQKKKMEKILEQKESQSTPSLTNSLTQLFLNCFCLSS
jgi:predicted HTH transcriptional regulator